MSAIENFKKHFQSDQKLMHFNNAGLAPISSLARDQICYWAERFYKEGFYTDHDYMAAIANSRQSLANIIGCNSEEVAFFQSTASAISQLSLHFPLSKNDEVIMWDQEYGSHLYPWQEACRLKEAKLILIESSKDWTTPVEKILDQITSRTRVIAVSWRQFLTGAETDLKTLGDLTRKKNIFLFVDVMQGLGLHPLNMKDWGIDAIAGGSHKWLTSPVGVGFLALDEKHIPMISPLNIGASTFGTCDDPTDLTCEPKRNALKYEAGSKQVLEITALGASIDLILKTGVTAIESEVRRLSKKLAEGLRSYDYQVFYNNSSIVNFVPKQHSLEKLESISCTYARRGPGLRLSPHAFNTDDEIEKILATLK